MPAQTSGRFAMPIRPRVPRPLCARNLDIICWHEMSMFQNRCALTNVHATPSELTLTFTGGLSPIRMVQLLRKTPLAEPCGQSIEFLLYFREALFQALPCAALPRELQQSCRAAFPHRRRSRRRLNCRHEKPCYLFEVGVQLRDVSRHPALKGSKGLLRKGTTLLEMAAAAGQRECHKGCDDEARLEACGASNSLDNGHG